MEATCCAARGCAVKKCIDAADIQAILNYTKENAISFSFMSEKEISIHDVTPEIAGMYAHWIYRASLVDLDNVDVNSVLQPISFGARAGSGFYGGSNAKLGSI